MSRHTPNAACRPRRVALPLVTIVRRSCILMTADYILIQPSIDIEIHKIYKGGEKNVGISFLLIIIRLVRVLCT